MGGGSGLSSRCGARSTRLALYRTRSFSGGRVYLSCMMVSSSPVSPFIFPSGSADESGVFHAAHFALIAFVGLFDGVAVGAQSPVGWR